MILCTDDPDRENEGDLICAAQSVTTEQVNFMATHGKGLICMPMSLEFIQRLRFPQMVSHNTDNHETALPSPSTTCPPPPASQRGAGGHRPGLRR